MANVFAQGLNKEVPLTGFTTPDAEQEKEGIKYSRTAHQAVLDAQRKMTDRFKERDDARYGKGLGAAYRKWMDQNPWAANVKSAIKFGAGAAAVLGASSLSGGLALAVAPTLFTLGLKMGTEGLLEGAANNLGKGYDRAEAERGKNVTAPSSLWERFKEYGRTARYNPHSIRHYISNLDIELTKVQVDCMKALRGDADKIGALLPRRTNTGILDPAEERQIVEEMNNKIKTLEGLRAQAENDLQKNSLDRRKTVRLLGAITGIAVGAFHGMPIDTDFGSAHELAGSHTVHLFTQKFLNDGAWRVMGEHAPNKGLSILSEAAGVLAPGITAAWQTRRERHVERQAPQENPPQHNADELAYRSHSKGEIVKDQNNRFTLTSKKRSTGIEENARAVDANTELLRMIQNTPVAERAVRHLQMQSQLAQTRGKEVVFLRTDLTQGRIDYRAQLKAAAAREELNGKHVVLIARRDESKDETHDLDEKMQLDAMCSGKFDHIILYDDTEMGSVSMDDLLSKFMDTRPPHHQSEHAKGEYMELNILPPPLPNTPNQPNQPNNNINVPEPNFADAAQRDFNRDYIRGSAEPYAGALRKEIDGWDPSPNDGIVGLIKAPNLRTGDLGVVMPDIIRTTSEIRGRNNTLPHRFVMLVPQAIYDIWKGSGYDQQVANIKSQLVNSNGAHNPDAFMPDDDIIFMPVSEPQRQNNNNNNQNNRGGNRQNQQNQQNQAPRSPSMGDFVNHIQARIAGHTTGTLRREDADL